MQMSYDVLGDEGRKALNACVKVTIYGKPESRKYDRNTSLQRLKPCYKGWNTWGHFHKHVLGRLQNLDRIGSDRIDKTRTGSDRINKTWIGLRPIDKTRTGSEKNRIAINFRRNSHKHLMIKFWHRNTTAFFRRSMKQSCNGSFSYKQEGIRYSTGAPSSQH